MASLLLKPLPSADKNHFYKKFIPSDNILFLLKTSLTAHDGKCLPVPKCRFRKTNLVRLWLHRHNLYTESIDSVVLLIVFVDNNINIDLYFNMEQKKESVI